MILDRLAIVGLGSIGRRHLKLISDMRPEIEIIAVRSGHGRAFKEEHRVRKTVYSIDDALSVGIQAAIISSPASLHLKQSVEFAKNGVHLLIEKPLTQTLEGIDSLLKEITASRSMVMVGYVLRHDPAAIKFKQLLCDRNFGEILHVRIECGSYLPNWRPDKNYRDTVSASSDLGGGVLLELSHELDYLHWFFGAPADVQAKMRNSGILDINVEDQANLLLTSSEGYPIIVQLDFNRRNPVRICNVITTIGQLTWNVVEKKVVFESVNNKTITYDYNCDSDSIYRKQLESFFSCIEQNTTPRVSLNEGVDVIRLIDAARQADKTGQKIFL